METNEIMENAEVIEETAENFDVATLDLKKVSAVGIAVGVVALAGGIVYVVGKKAKPFVTKKHDEWKEKREAKKNSKVVACRARVKDVEEESDDEK